MQDKDENTTEGLPEEQYIPQHEKPAQDTAETNVDIPVASAEDVKPVYDDFMYEPIGFEELPDSDDTELIERKTKRTKGESAAIILFSLMLGVCIAAALFGIIRDIKNSTKAIVKSTEKEKIVLYRNSKPEGANDLSNFVDENGKYTIEGAAAAVIDSIVEIYTYSDASHNTFVGSGSGIVISKDGYIVTNAHVLQADGYHTVITNDDKKYDAKIIGRDSKTDIAVIKVTAEDLKPAELGNSDETIVGETVIAVGNPAGLSFTVTDGIVSHIGRKIRGKNNTGFEMECIQTNAEISPGNSGGALVNMYGQVIGITSSKLISDTLEGLGFAISINEALPIIEELIDKGYIEGRFRIGISLVDTSTESKRAAIKQELGYDIPKDFKGIYVSKISEDSDLNNTSMKVGDFFTEINGKTVTTYTEFYDTISSQYTVGDKVPATCAHIDKNGDINYYHIEFGLIEDKSGDY